MSEKTFELIIVLIFLFIIYIQYILHIHIDLYNINEMSAYDSMNSIDILMELLSMK